MLKPGELLMQLHHFADHQQGGHRGVFRQVFELLQCAGYRLLIVTGAAGNYRHRRVAVATEGDQLRADFRCLHGAHVDRQRLLALRQQRPVEGGAVRLIVAGDKDGALRIIAMGQRNTGVGRRPGSSSDARHHLERDPRFGGSLQQRANVLNQQVTAIPGQMLAFQEGSAKAWELTRMLNPLSHGHSAKAVEVYKVEPYVISADVYAVAPHAGRGGWSWYTGSAGWMYQLLVESLLGLRLEGARLQLSPVLPADWPGFSLDYRFGDSLYQIHVQQSPQADNNQSVSLDGVLQPTAEVQLRDDGQPHRIDIHCAAT